MTLPTLVPPRPPDVGLARKRTYQVRLAAFGDGYSQRVAAGLNSESDMLSIKWSYLAPDVAQELEDFFDARGGWEAFLWQSPHDANAHKWLCSEWTRTHTTGLLDDVDCTFTRVYDLD
jgi:phage-related protein